MQPARLGVWVWSLVCTTLLGLLALAPPSGAQQAVLETPQQTNDRIRELSAAVRTMPHDYVIGPGDVLSIDVFDVKELSRDVRVSQTGTIGIPLVPVRLHVAGLTEVQAEQKIAEVLEANGLVSHPDVSVSVKERKSKPITVVGAVSRPMVYQADGQVTLLEILAEAGGLANDAGDEVIVTRPVPVMTFEDYPSPASGLTDGSSIGSEPRDGKPSTASGGTNSSPGSGSSGEPPEIPSPTSAQGKSDASSSSTSGPPSTETITVNLYELMESGNTSHNIPLQSGDVVTVPHSGIVYVMGAVAKPGGFVLTNDREKLTTLKILALAGGFTSTAKTDHAVVIRKDAQGKEYQVPLDLKKIQNRKMEDLQLQPSDILFVPQSGAKQALLRSVEFGIALGSGVALYRLAYR
ncbi:MAG TPA: polysaccharide biosynthesis/export family protein [Candidatus Methylomirabilis sp.]|nr:polysaccharide biosynthesis/export family protein [Candidatus Methylomirabilis sp.]